MNNLRKIFLFLLTIVALYSCRNNEEDTQTTQIVNNEDHNHEHEEEEWSKVEFRFIEGHSHGYFHGTPEYPGLKYLKVVQRYVFEYKDGKLVPSKDNPKAIRWRGDDLSSIALTGLEIIYYNDKGERVKAYSGEAGEHHQHFFLAENIRANKNEPNVELPTEAFSYRYRDTDPEDLYFKVPAGSTAPTSKLIKERIGVKGFFKVNKSYVDFDLRVILGHYGKKPLDLPYNTIPQIREYDVKIPIHIYTDFNYEDRLLKDAANEFGVSEEEIQKDAEIRLTSDINGESSVIHL